MTQASTWFDRAPLVIAHRGASAYVSENSLDAFDLAMEQGTDAIEFDVRFLKDEKFIVFHDALFQRRPLHLMTLDQVCEVWESGKESGEIRSRRPPELSEVLQRYAGKLNFNIEIKCEGIPKKEMGYSLVKLLKLTNSVEDVLVSSFNPLVLGLLQREAPGILLGLLLHPVRVVGTLIRLFAPYHAIHPNFNMVTRRMISRAHARGTHVIT